jgi:hypothetical protein
MGWTVTHEKKLKPFIEDLVREYHTVTPDGNGEQRYRVCLAHSYAMASPGEGTLYAVWEVWKTYLKTGATVPIEIAGSKKRFIAIYLCKFYGGRGRADGWGYKDMDESCGPNEVHCPLSFLQLAPDPAPGNCGGCGKCGTCWSRSWRDKVRSYHADAEMKRRTLAGLKVGDKVWLRSYSIGGVAGPFTIAATATGKKRTVTLDTGGGRWSMTAKMLDWEKTLAEMQGVELA